MNKIKKNASKHFGSLQLKSLNKLGDILIPGDHEFPSFSKLGCVEHFDRIADYMPEGDRNDLKLLLTVFYFIPKPLLGFKMRVLEWMFDHDVPMPGVFRLIRLGVRGLVMSLYYSGATGDAYREKTPDALLDFSVNVYTADLKEAPSQPSVR